MNRTRLASARRRGVDETAVLVLCVQAALQADRRFGTDELREDLAVVADLLDDVVAPLVVDAQHLTRSEEHTSELQSLMRISYAVFCLKKQKNSISRTAVHARHSIARHMNPSQHID